MSKTVSVPEAYLTLDGSFTIMCAPHEVYIKLFHKKNNASTTGNNYKSGSRPIEVLRLVFISDNLEKLHSAVAVVSEKLQTKLPKGN